MAYPLAFFDSLNPVTLLMLGIVALLLFGERLPEVGRTWGRRILTKWRRLERFSERVLPPSERFFARHGGKTVFFGRFIAILRITSAWLAGVSRMPWWQFFFWNASGGILWATLVSLLAYYVGKAAAEALNRYGLFAGLAIAGAAAVVLVLLHLWRRRIVPEDA